MVSNAITGIFGRDNRNYQPEVEPDQGLKAYAESLDLKSIANGKSALGNYDLKSNPEETIAKLKEEFHAATDGLESYFKDKDEVPFFKRKLPEIEFNIEAKEATVKLINALNSDFDTRGKNSYLLTDDGKDLMKKLISFLPLKSEGDDEELKPAQNAAFSLLSKQLANTKTSSRLDTISKDLVLRMQAPVYARDDKRKYNLALTLMRNLGPKEFAKPAEKNGEFVNVYKRIQDAFSIGGDKEIGKEFAKNIHEIIAPILEGPINSELEKTLGESTVNAIKEIRKQVWANAEDTMLAASNISKLSPKMINYRGADGSVQHENTKDHAQTLINLVKTINELYVDNKFEANEKLELTVRDLAYESHMYGMQEADALALKKSLRGAITGELGKVTPVVVPVGSLSDEQKKTSLGEMLLQSANRVKAALDTQAVLGSDNTASSALPDGYSVASVKLQSEIAKKISTLSREDSKAKFKIGGDDVELTKKQLQEVSNQITSMVLVSKSDINTIIPDSDDTAGVTAKRNLLTALLNEDRLTQINAAAKVIDTEQKAFDKMVQLTSSYEKAEGETAAKGLDGIVALANQLDTYKVDDKLKLQTLADVGRTAGEKPVDVNKVFKESGNTEIAFQIKNDSEGKKLANDLLKIVQADADKFGKLKKQAAKDADNIVTTVVSSLNKAGLTSVAHRLVESFHEFITGGDPDSGEINSDRVRDVLAKDNSSSGGLGNVDELMRNYIGSKQAAQETQMSMLRNEQAQKLGELASNLSFGKTSGMDDLAILKKVVGDDTLSDKENAIAKFIDFADNLYKKTQENGRANSAFNISDEDKRKLLVVNRGDNLAMAERDVHLKKTMLAVLNALNNDRSDTMDVVSNKERLVKDGTIVLPGSSELSKFTKETERLANSFETKMGDLEFSAARKTKFDSFDDLLAVEQEHHDDQGLRPDANNLLKRIVDIFTGLFTGNKSDAISAYKSGVVDKLKNGDEQDAFKVGLHSAMQPH